MGRPSGGGLAFLCFVDRDWVARTVGTVELKSVCSEPLNGLSEGLEMDLRHDRGGSRY